MADKQIKLLIHAILKDKRFKAGMKGMGTQFDKTGKKSQGFFKTLKMGWLAIAAGVYATIRAFKAFVRVAAEFEQAVANVASVSGDATEEIAKLAREAGKAKLGFSAKQAADALYFLASAGLAVEDMAKVLQPTLRLAAATQIEIAAATNVVVNQLKVYGGDMSKAAMFTDIMAKTVASANTNMQQLGDALNYSASVASLAGVSFADLNAMIAAMADLGIKGGKAGVQLRMAFVRLLKPTSRAAEILKTKYNIEIKELQRLLKEGRVIDALKMLNEANIDVADSLELFGVRQSTFIKLVSDGIPIIEKLQKKIADAGGTAQTMADKQLDTLKGKQKILNAAWKEMIHTLSGGGGLLPAMKDLTDAITDVIVKFTDWISKTAEGRKTMEVFTKTITISIMLLANVFVNAFNVIKSAIMTVVTSYKTLVEAVVAASKGKLKDALKIMKDGMKETGETLVETYASSYEMLVKTVKDSLGIINETNDRIKEGAEETYNALTELDKRRAKEWGMFQDKKVNTAKSALQKIIIAEMENFESVKDETETFLSSLNDYASAQVTIEKNKLDKIADKNSEAYKKQRDLVWEAASKERSLKIQMAFIDAAAAILKTMATVPFPLNIPLVIAQTAAGLAQVRAIQTTPLPSFAKGIEDVQRTMIAQLHKGERVIPANRNIPQLSNEAYSAAAMQGIAAMSGSNNITNNNTENISNTANNTFNVPPGTVGMEELMEFAERTNSQILQR